MTPEARDLLRGQLLVDEGLRLKPYIDTVGKTTIGIGRNLTDVGITSAEAYLLLDNDIGIVVRDLRATYRWFDALDDVRQVVVANMRFQLGAGGFAEFQHLHTALARRDYPVAAAEMLNSAWAKQVPDRAIRLAKAMESGRFQP